MTSVWLKKNRLKEKSYDRMKHESWYVTVTDSSIFFSFLGLWSPVSTYCHWRRKRSVFCGTTKENCQFVPQFSASSKISMDEIRQMSGASEWWPRMSLDETMATANVAWRGFEWTLFALFTASPFASAVHDVTWLEMGRQHFLRRSSLFGIHDLLIVLSFSQNWRLWYGGQINKQEGPVQ